MKKFTILFGLFILITASLFAQSKISEARQQAIGSTVTVTGIAINGSEFGSIRYFEDETGGIAAYSYDLLSNVQRGDEITVTGILKDYNNLLEIDPVSEITINSTGNDLPVPQLITPEQLGEEHEGELVQLSGVTIEGAGTAFSGNQNYQVLADGQSCEIRIKNGQDLVGTIIPSGKTIVTGVCSQYMETYQILPRDILDVVPASLIYITSELKIENIATNGFDLLWSTNIAGTTQINYGKTPELELGSLTVEGETSEHKISITDASASELLYIQAITEKDGITTKSPVKVFITKSESSGDIKVYFNRETEHLYSGGTDAITLDRAVDDTVINYINRAKYSIDFAIYNYHLTGISNISTALNNAYARGLQVRIIHDSNINNSGIDQLNPEIGRLSSPLSNFPEYGIMHNKFLVIDANSTDPNDPIVWTGGTNFTDGQVNSDPNDVIIIQDKSLALTYQIEFNEMFGNSGAQPNEANSKFGKDKKDNTPHYFVINDIAVECYFSPSDGVNSKIVKVINSADKNLSIATMLITRTEIANAIQTAKENNVNTKVLVNAKGNCSETVVSILGASLGSNFIDDPATWIMHHKYMIVDHKDPSSDPQVLTGCHNWSAAANTINDENILIVHDQEIANIYFQEFAAQFANSGGSFDETPAPVSDKASTTQNTDVTIDLLSNDDTHGDVNISFAMLPLYGSIEVNADNTVTYTPENNFSGKENILYKTCSTAFPQLCGMANLSIEVAPTSVNKINSILNIFDVYPNPSDGLFTVELNPNMGELNIQVIDQSGKIIAEKEILVLSEAKKIYFEVDNMGLYIVKITGNKFSAINKVIIY